MIQDAQFLLKSVDGFYESMPMSTGLLKYEYRASKISCRVLYVKIWWPLAKLLH